MATINNNNSISLSREDDYICLQNSYISVDFEVLKQDDTRFADGDQIALVNFGPVALVSEAKLTTSSGKLLEKVDILYTVSLMNKLLTSGQQTIELMYGFEESQATRKLELTTNKTEKGTFFLKIKLTDLFGFADPEKVTFGLGYILFLKRNNNIDPDFRTAGVDAAKIVIKDIGWYIPLCTPILENQQGMMDQLLKQDPNELFYMERIVFRKDVNTNNNWTFDLGNSGESTPSFVIVGFQARNKIDSQTHHNAIFDRLRISNAVCKIGSEKNPVDGNECDYDRDNCSEAYQEIENFYRLHTETNILRPFIDLHKLRTNHNFYPNEKIILPVNLLV